MEESIEVLISDEDRKPDYDNSGPLDIHLFNSEQRVVNAVTYLCSEIGYTGQRAVQTMTMVLLNLYRTYLLDQERWLGYSRWTNRYNLVFRYNRLRITYRTLINVMDGLEVKDYVEDHKGSEYSGRCTRIRAKLSLIDLLTGDYRWTPEVIKSHEDEELLLLRDQDKKPLEYDENASTTKMRKFLKNYNAFIDSTYIDLDHQGYRPAKTIHVDLSKKRLKRIFNNGSFSLGGRFYGGWWIGVPGKLRLRIIINNHKVAECDYSNMSIHLLYMRKGIDYGKYGRDAYTLPGYGDDDKTRNMFKLLLLAMLSSDSERAARAALQGDINFYPDDYPVEIPDLKEVVKDFADFHAPIADYFYHQVGLEVMYQDSQIAQTVMQTMMDHGVPVLPVHDSFICPKKDADSLQSAMLAAFRLHAPKKYKLRLPRIRIKYEEHLVDGVDDGCYYYDVLSVTDQSLLDRLLLFDRTGGLPVMHKVTLYGATDR